MNRNEWVRQIHRWLSIVFTLAVIVNFAALGQEQPAAWAGLLALLPLALLLFSGLYLLVLPHAIRRRSRRCAVSTTGRAAGGTSEEGRP